MAGCIAVVSDVVDTEVADAPDDIYERLTDDAARFRRAFGVMVAGHSRAGSTVLGGEADLDLMDELRAVIRPGITDWTKVRRQHTRDVMHVHTAIRSGADGFVTDDQALLKKAEALRAYIRVWTPRKAAQIAMKRLRNYRITSV